jgi:hypothetical protein
MVRRRWRALSAIRSNVVASAGPRPPSTVFSSRAKVSFSARFGVEVNLEGVLVQRVDRGLALLDEPADHRVGGQPGLVSASPRGGEVRDACLPRPRRLDRLGELVQPASGQLDVPVHCLDPHPAVELMNGRTQTRTGERPQWRFH